jgi:signal transduction histidine kinase
MTDAEPDPAARLRHDLANPLAAILAEVQLVLLHEDRLPDDVLDALRAIESQALRMRTLLRA